MSIRIAEFGGLAPKVAPDRLGDGGAVAALNCDVTSGALRPLSVEGPFTRLHDEATGLLLSGVPLDEVKQLAKPSPPVVLERTMICKPDQWPLYIYYQTFVSYINDSGQQVVSGAWNGQGQQLLPVTSWRYTETGLDLVCTMPASAVYTFNNGGPYAVRGPKYKFVFPVAAGVKGGSGIAVSSPPALAMHSPELPYDRVPLTDETGNIYAYFEVVDVCGPRFDTDILVTDYDYITQYFPYVPTGVMFKINLNYVEARRRHFYYVSSALNGTGDDAEEGPPSEVSSRILIKPGERVKLKLGNETDWNRRVYRSQTGGDDFLLVAEGVGNTFLDVKPTAQPEVIPPYGNFPGEDKAAFLEGSILHPGHFGVAKWGTEVYLSDQYRLWAWARKWVLGFVENVDALALSGNTVLVFSDGNVFGLSGGHPASMARYLISDTAPLLGKRGLCRIGNTVFWPTLDGLAACNGSSVEIITGEYYTREQWLELNPATMAASVADGSIYLELNVGEALGSAPADQDWTTIVLASTVYGGRALSVWPALGDDTGLKLRLDLDEGLKRVTEFEAYSGGTVYWRSKGYRSVDAVRMDFGRVVADAYPVTLEVFGDGALLGTYTVLSAAPFVLDTGSSGNPDLASAREWSAAVATTQVVREIDLYSRQVVTVSGEVRLGRETVECWRNIWLKFGDEGRWPVGILSAETTSAVEVRFWHGDSLVHTATVTNGRPFALPRVFGESTDPDANLWRIEVVTDAPVDELRLLQRVDEVAGGTVVAVRSDGGVAPWLRTRWVLGNDVRLTSIEAHSDATVSMRVYFDGAVEPSDTIEITGIEPVLLNPGVRPRTVEFDFDGDDGLVRVVKLHASAPAAVGRVASIAGATNWRGLLLRFPDVGRFRCFSVGAFDYTDLELRLWVDGVWLDPIEVADGRVYALPRDLDDCPYGSLWMVDVSGGEGIDRVTLWPEEAVQAGSTVHVLRREYPEWLPKRFSFGDATQVVSGRVAASDYSGLYVRLYADGAETYTKRVRVADGDEFAISGMPLCRSLEFDFAKLDGDELNGVVTQVTLFTREVIQVGGGPVVLDGRANWLGLLFEFAGENRFGCAQVQASSYPVSFQVMAGEAGATYTVADASPFYLVDHGAGANATVSVSGAGKDIERVTLWPMRRETARFPLRLLGQGSGPPAWWYTEWDVPDRLMLRSVVVKSGVYPVGVRVVRNQREEVLESETTAVADGSEAPLTTGGETSAFRVRFTDSPYTGVELDAEVREAIVYAEEHVAIDGSGVVLRGGRPGEGWLNRTLRFPDTGSWCVARVVADGYSGCRLVLEANGVTQVDMAVADGDAFRLEALAPLTSIGNARDWSLRLYHAGAVRELMLFSERLTEFDGRRIVLRRDQEPWTWLDRRFIAPKVVEFSCARVVADVYPVTLRLYRDTALAATIPVANAKPFRLPRLAAIRRWSFDVVGAPESQIHEVGLAVSMEELR